MLRKSLCRILCVIVILCLTVPAVFASGKFDGSDRLGSISFDFNTKELHVKGGSVELRMVAFWDNDSKSLQWCEDYVAAGLSIEQLFDEKDAALLSAYAADRQLPALSVKIQSDGTGRADNLALGVYLVSQKQAFDSCEPLLPALISVPLEINEEWVFDVEAAPKLAPLVPETTAPSTEPTPPDLPPTGQINWPIPLLIVGGIFLILLGLCLRKGRRHEP